MIEVVAVLTAFLLSSGDLPVRATDVPARFEARLGSRPVWVARERTTATEALRRGELTETQIENIRSRMESTSRWRATTHGASDDGRCAALFAGYIADGGDDNFAVGSLSALREVAPSRTVMAGRVVAVRPGFHNGQPFSVIAIDRPAASTVYLLYPYARVEVDGSLICNADPSFADLPRLGEPIAFVASAPFDATQRLYYVRGDRIFYERDSAVVSAPALAMDPDLLNVRSLGQLLEQLHPERPPSPRERE